MRQRAAKAAAEDQTLPASCIRRIISGESPLRVYREHRGMSREDLASASGVQSEQIDRIESGRVEVAAGTIMVLAAALSISLDKLS
ncbi:helix-turn-helix domain-containing protein [Croceibacterium xixiisoli]|uniref:helix-turn-helix domain-containing protein n=1 Tax=Croceibacterium xixiisoli TaxID=1476466 RepID=UPI001368F367|nr:helix-turn-helix transcriptional regulator [Croceibacterium xixiisoli]